MAGPNLFRSARLSYRAIEDTAEDDDFLTLVQRDPEAFANSSTFLIKPQSKKLVMESNKKWLTEEALLGVVVCLPAPQSDVKPDDAAYEMKVAEPVPIGLVALTQDPNHLHHRNAEMAVDIIAAHQGQGYGSEAIAWGLQWAFQIAGLHRVTIECISYNEGAGRLYKKLGFTPEGTDRESVYFNGEFHNILRFGMLEGEWRDRFSNKALPFRK